MTLMKRPSNRFTVLPFSFVPLFLFGFVINIANGHERPQKTNVLRTPTKKPLQFSSNSSFKIAVFADLHYGEDAWTDWGPRQDAKSDRVMSTILDQEVPDFVVYLGDLITANNLPIPNASLYWDRAISPTRARGIPWATVFGNHDDMPFEWPIEWFSSSGIPQLRCSPTNSTTSEACSFRGTLRVELMKNEMQQNWLSYSTNGPQELWPGVSNYVLQVSSSDGQGLPVAFLYFLDSGGGSYPEVISNTQAKWFQNKSQELNPKLSVPEIIFWHIPSKAYEEVAPFFWIFKPCVGSINKESVAAQEAEMGIMDFLINRPSVKAVFVGHNHGLDWCCPYENLWLCYARHTGYGGYGNWPRGARIIEMTQQPFSLKSWIRMEDGVKHSEVVLSS
ncbi:probable inactive purple acid phosphatase 16 isoform X2 [Telopea speciosissima]|uniref:probable inactive purple acid phosphatase 16 isoform X2 n=1 Tax=Telopea speciosissima TaxID=54955 RepID=UPI001CC789D1|nr:probable inactive purple acid phosphatase 16 isoform X2 [Telopea speciosissima]